MLTEVIGCQSYREPEGSGWETEVWGKGTGPRSPLTKVGKWQSQEWNLGFLTFSECLCNTVSTLF